MVYAHVPVLLEECVDALQPHDGGIYVDCTLGGGGHSEAILNAADCRVIGIDRDPAALEAATSRFEGTPLASRFSAMHSAFGEIDEVLDSLGIDRVHGILADLGVSSHQLDTPERGFSFRTSGPIDMRMDPTRGVPASTLVNEWPQAELADVIFQFGEDRKSRRIARAIVEGRPWDDTLALAEAIAIASPQRGARIHPATRTFQALRIAVNAELDQVQTLLEASLRRLESGGRLAVISFHSLEDRIVKRFFAAQSGKTAPRDPWGHPMGPVHLRVLPPVTPTPDDPNPRARSARLRVAERLPWNAP